MRPYQISKYYALIQVILSLVLLSFTPLAHSQGSPSCGDLVCSVGEDTQNCPGDCGKPRVVSSSERFLANGPAVRAVEYGKFALIGVVSPHDNDTELNFLQFSSSNQNIVRTSNVLKRPHDDSGGLGNPDPIVLPSGKFLLAFRDHTGGSNNRVYRLRVTFSEDEGKTWRTGSDINDGLIDQDRVGLWEPFLFLDAQGTLRVIYAKEREQSNCPSFKGRKQDLVMRVSRDGGHVWGEEAIVASDGVSRDGVPAVTRLKDGSYILVFESWRDPTCGHADPSLVIRSMQSRDGAKWSKRSVVYIPAQRQMGSKKKPIASWPFVTVLRDGRLAVTFTTNQDRSNYDNKERPESRRDFDIMLLLSKGGPSFDSLEWDMQSLTRVFEFTPESASINRYASSVVVDDKKILVFSGLPSRLRVVTLGN